MKLMLCNGIWDHLNDLLHKSLSSVRAIGLCIPLSLLGNGSVKKLDESFSMGSVWYQKKVGVSSSQNFLYSFRLGVKMDF
jgi:hypothetical protein